MRIKKKEERRERRKKISFVMWLSELVKDLQRDFLKTKRKQKS